EPPTGRQNLRGGFNPCCPGFGSSTRAAGQSVLSPLRVSILVVLDSAPHRRGSWTMPGRRRRFNPCCPGFGTSTRSSTTSSSSSPVFQSLLSWIRLLNGPEVWPASNAWLLVSILVVLDSAPQPRIGRYSNTNGRGWVSILVVLDSAPQ